MAENSTAVTTVTATDPDAGATVTFSVVGGADQNMFTINAATGALSFVTAPDFEAPTDAGANNEVRCDGAQGTQTDYQDASGREPLLAGLADRSKPDLA